MRDADRLLGVLMGTAIGDAIGLPFEGLSPRRIDQRLRRGPLGHSLVFGRGMISDDTEHACMVARALLESDGDVDRFRRRFAAQLRRWLLALPPAVGLATLRACVRLCVGFGPERSGVDSAGNGPAMRAALLGVWADDDRQRLALVRASTRITHTDPRAEDGALLIARWAADASRVHELACVRDAAMRDRIRSALACAEAGASVEQARATLGFERGVSGFVVDTLAAVAFCWRRHRDDPSAAIEAAVRLGGDTDTVAAIVGALLGAELGARELERRIDPAWIEGLHDWPINLAYLRRLARAFARRDRAPRQPWFAAPLRNLAFLGIVLAHGCARALGK
ncbi:MAG TPA: ADP-ribosylglycohydrolase family protein [Enhygromyxa sp.]|nr:ADP-ribosylglycohydrolase family protein [Enhygromyxa sp.]